MSSGNWEGTCEFRAVLPATLKAVEEFMAEFRCSGVHLPDSKVCFTAELLLREALNNSVLHGCGGDASRTIRCALRRRRGRLLIAVQDDGTGFDWRRATESGSGPMEVSGRGLEIIRQYATRVRFNAAGNAVAIMKRF